MSVRIGSHDRHLVQQVGSSPNFLRCDSGTLANGTKDGEWYCAPEADPVPTTRVLRFLYEGVVLTKEKQPAQQNGGHMKTCDAKARKGALGSGCATPGQW